MFGGKEFSDRVIFDPSSDFTAFNSRTSVPVISRESKNLLGESNSFESSRFAYPARYFAPSSTRVVTHDT